MHPYFNLNIGLGNEIDIGKKGRYKDIYVHYYYIYNSQERTIYNFVDMIDNIR